jgi:hypothetical protein
MLGNKKKGFERPSLQSGHKNKKSVLIYGGAPPYYLPKLLGFSSPPPPKRSKDSFLTKGVFELPIIINSHMFSLMQFNQKSYYYWMGFGNLMFPLWFALLGGFFCLLGHGSFLFVPCIPPFLGALVYI